jgi:hypothetical protein
MPCSFATAEKLPLSTTRTNICIAANLSTAASVFLYGIDAIQGVWIRLTCSHPLCIPIGNSCYSLECHIGLPQWDIQIGEKEILDV